MSVRPRSIAATLAHNIVLRLVVYYAALGGAAVLVWSMLPAARRRMVAESLSAILGPDVLPSLAAPETLAKASGSSSSIPVLAEALSMTSAFLVALPMAWVYMFTRQKKGYRQTTVHSLILLPTVVAGVVAMVKHSLPLAFSLAGIVAAVRFRNTLDDSRDAVYLFLATALGLAAAVQVDVAFVLSIVFNAVVLSLWYTDFARTPPMLEGERARRKLERALAMANRTSQFVAHVDREILSTMAPPQLDALAQRLERARSSGDPAAPRPPRYDARIRVAVTDGGAGRAVVEGALERHAKRWRYAGSSAADGAEVIEYDVRLRKGIVPGAVADALRRDGAPYVVTADVN